MLYIRRLVAVIELCQVGVDRQAERHICFSFALLMLDDSQLKPYMGSPEFPLL